jgi:hypothetical protein
MQLPNDPEYALVVGIDSLPPVFQDFITDLLLRDGQKVTSFAQTLMGRQMPNSTKSVLQGLHESALLQRVSVDNVMMLPRANMPIPLRAILEEMGNLTRTENSTKINQFMLNDQVGKSESARQQANDFIAQAQLLEADARAYREKAYALWPELRPAPAPISQPISESEVSTTTTATKRAAPKAKAPAAKKNTKSKVAG